jgi:hypothetical protein
MPLIQPPTEVAGRPRAGANLVTDYYDQIRDAIGYCVEDPSAVTVPERFAPAYALPALDQAVRRYFEVATASWRTAGEYRGRRLVLLDLTGNPGTHTTKTFSSLLIVARAVEHIRRTGEPVTLFSPTSANKGTALRDAVHRAITCGLVDPALLNVAVLAPATSLPKLRGGGLAADPELSRLNPVFLYDGAVSENVKAIGREFADRYSERLGDRRRLWYSLDLRNYVVADTMRAYFEQDVEATGDAERARIHAHAVSSAFGMLGYHTGRELLEAAGVTTAETRPRTLLVQHLGAPDMVLSLTTGTFESSGRPIYQDDPVTGLFVQSDSAHFPAAAGDPHEVLDPTFYTRRPATSPRMNEIIRRYGGSGIVVSLAECLARYSSIRRWVAAGSDRPMPADPRKLREWSTVMAFTGVLESIDRGLIGPDEDVIVHGSGWYSDGEYEALPAEACHYFGDADDIARVLRTS